MEERTPMDLHPIDLAIIGVYLFLMAMVGALFYLGLKALWATHIFWGWFIICFYMAFQAKWIRRSGVMTFAEWNETRFGATRDAEAARVAAAIFLLVLMIFNLMFIAVGTGKFAEEFLPFPRWESALIVFAAVGVYVVLGGFFGVLLTDIFQTALIALGAVVLAVMAFPERLSCASIKGSSSITTRPSFTAGSSGMIPLFSGKFRNSSKKAAGRRAAAGISSLMSTCPGSNPSSGKSPKEGDTSGISLGQSLQRLTTLILSATAEGCLKFSGSLTMT